MVHKLAFYDVYSLWFSHRLLANQSQYIHINSVRKFSALFNNSVDISVCIHFTIFFDLLSLQRQHPLPRSESELTIPGTKVPGNIRCWERKFPGTFVLRSESFRELSFLGVKVPTTFALAQWELSLRGAKIPGSEKSWYRGQWSPLCGVISLKPTPVPRKLTFKCNTVCNFVSVSSFSAQIIFAFKVRV